MRAVGGKPRVGEIALRWSAHSGVEGRGGLIRDESDDELSFALSMGNALEGRADSGKRIRLPDVHGFGEDVAACRITP